MYAHLFMVMCITGGGFCVGEGAYGPLMRFAVCAVRVLLCARGSGGRLGWGKAFCVICIYFLYLHSCAYVLEFSFRHEKRRCHSAFWNLYL